MPRAAEVICFRARHGLVPWPRADQGGHHAARHTGTTNSAINIHARLWDLLLKDGERDAVGVGCAAGHCGSLVAR